MDLWLSVFARSRAGDRSKGLRLGALQLCAGCGSHGAFVGSGIGGVSAGIEECAKVRVLVQGGI